jgi:hypothetical protein
VPGGIDGPSTCAMNCDVCFLAFCALRRRGGDGESELEVTEMTSGGSGSRFLLRRGGGEDSEGEGRKRGVLDMRRESTRSARMRTAGRQMALSHGVCIHAEGTLERMYLYRVLVKEANSDVGGGVRGRRLILLHGVCMGAGEVGVKVHTSPGPWSRSGP